MKNAFNQAEGREEHGTVASYLSHPLGGWRLQFHSLLARQNAFVFYINQPVDKIHEQPLGRAENVTDSFFLASPLLLCTAVPRSLFGAVSQPAPWSSAQVKAEPLH